MSSVAPSKCLICSQFYDRKPLLLRGDGGEETRMAEVFATFKDGFKTFWNLSDATSGNSESSDDEGIDEDDPEILLEFEATDLDHPCCESCFAKLKELQRYQRTIEETKELQKILVKNLRNNLRHAKSTTKAENKLQMADSTTVDKWESLRQKTFKHFGLHDERNEDQNDSGSLGSIVEDDTEPVVFPPDDTETENEELERDIAESSADNDSEMLVEDNDAEPIVAPPDDNEKENEEMKRESFESSAVAVTAVTDSSHSCMSLPTDDKVLNEASTNEILDVDIEPGPSSRTESKPSVMAIEDEESSDLEGGTALRRSKRTRVSTSTVSNNVEDAKKEADKAKPKPQRKKRTHLTMPPKKRKANVKCTLTLEQRIKDVQSGDVCYCDGCGKALMNAQFFMCTSCLTYEEDGSIGFDLCLPCQAKGLHNHHEFRRVYHLSK